MLIRITGGKAGIAEYLEKGMKNGRDFTRDELDQRHILDGDLSLTDNIIKNMSNKGERYLHVTLAFKEDYVSSDVLKKISDDFKKFALRAYDDDEYNFYAEAHLPRIKSYVDKSTGEEVDRKPHVHIVIPEYNLKTGKKLEPFGLVDNNKRYIDAFQEITNEKYSLLSPKVEVRKPMSAGDLVARQKGDIFPSLNRETKSDILKLVLEKNISSLSELSDCLKERNFDVTERNKGKANVYLNIKLPEQKKGINLKESVFQPNFLQLNKQEKEDALAPTISYRTNKSYLANNEHHKDLSEWKKSRAYELRYVNRRNRAEYKSLSPDEKQNFLNEKRGINEPARSISAASFDDIKRTLEYANKTLGAAERYLSNAQRHSGQFESGIRNITQRRIIRDVITNSSFHDGNKRDINRQNESVVPVNDVLEQYRQQLKASKNTIDSNELKRTDAKQLLNALSVSHGLIKEKYQITTGKDGLPRIKCGNRNLNVSDFLTKEMNMTWKEAKSYLEKRRTLEYETTNVTSKNIISAAWKLQLSKEKIERSEYIEQYKLEKKAIYADTNLTKIERNQALSIAQMNKVINDIHFKKKVTSERELLTPQNFIKKGNTMDIDSYNKRVLNVKNTYADLANAHPMEREDKLVNLHISSESIGADGYKLKVTESPFKGTELERSFIKGYKDAKFHDTGIDKDYSKFREEEVNRTTQKSVTLKLDENLEASRLIYHFPKLKDLGITTLDVNKTDKGDKIKYNDKELSVTELIKVTHNLSSKETIDKLKPIYDAQESDKKRVLEFKNKWEVEKRIPISEMMKEDEKINTLSSSKAQHKESPHSEIKPISYDEAIHHKKNKDGSITYYQESDKLITDRGKDIIVESKSNKAIDIGLRLAVEKYGSVLDVNGTDEYKNQIIQSAARNKLNVSFVDKQMNIDLEQARANLNLGRNTIAKAETKLTAQNEPQKTVAHEQKKAGFER